MEPLASDIEHAVSAHGRHLEDGPLRDAWTAAAAKLRAATSQEDVDALHVLLRDATRHDSRAITAGAALAVLNGLLVRVKKARYEAPAESDESTAKKARRGQAP